MSEVPGGAGGVRPVVSTPAGPAGSRVGPADGRATWARQLPCDVREQARPQDCVNGLVTLHREDDPLHFRLAPATSTPRPRPVRSPGIERYTEAVAATVEAVLRRR